MWWGCTGTDSRRTAPSPPVVAGEGGGTPCGFPGGSPDGSVGPAVAAPGVIQWPNQRRRAPEHLKDYVLGDGVGTTEPSGGSWRGRLFQGILGTRWLPVV